MKQPNRPATSISGMHAISEPPAIRDLVTDRLREAIITGGFTEGLRLRQEGIAQTLGVSRMPVRDAIKALAAEGLLVEIRGGGAMVPVLDERETRDVLGIREVLERRAIERLLEQRPADSGLPQPSPTTMALGAARRHIQFHRALGEATQDRFLISAMAPLWGTLERLVVRSSGFPAEFERLDEALYRAIRLGQPTQAMALLDESFALLGWWVEQAMPTTTTVAERVS